MQRQEPPVFFDKGHASEYDRRNAKLAPLNEALYLLTSAVLANHPVEAKVLCVGAGTGAELIYLARKFPQWHFTAVEPSAPMLDVCRQKAEACGILSRCVFHNGYLDSLPATEPFDAATSFLVSQFILAPEGRINFFHAIARRLRPGGCLVNADLTSDTTSTAYQSLLNVWFQLIMETNANAEKLEALRTAYSRDVGVLPAERVSGFIASGGFETPVSFFQAGLVHAWYAKRA